MDAVKRLQLLRARSDLLTVVGLKIVTVVNLIQPERLDCRLIDCSRDWQALIALEVCEDRADIDT
ncbi:MAG: hypothetical protein DMG62_21670 [Acidobacteria bacterium]|nr:MAG: hypothetical protein DMG62_21670 [Acidobacteriota bacterium]